MAGIADTTVVDRIELHRSSVVLVMVETREWGSDPLQAEQLKQKINRYTGYVVEGQLAADYPDLVEPRVVVRLECVSEPTGEFARIVEVTTSGLGRLGVTFAVTFSDGADRAS